MSNPIVIIFSNTICLISSISFLVYSEGFNLRWSLYNIQSTITVTNRIFYWHSDVGFTLFLNDITFVIIIFFFKTIWNRVLNLNLKINIYSLYLYKCISIQNNLCPPLDLLNVSLQRYNQNKFMNINILCPNKWELLPYIIHIMNFF